MKTLLLLDANSLIHRAFHALPPLTSPDGKPAQALYGLARALSKLWKEERPWYAAALFDRPEPTFRKEKYKEYKAQRPPTPEDLVSQIVEAPNLFHSFGIRTLDKAGLEADDLIATLATRFSRKGEIRVVILTGDLDTLQLVKDDYLVVRAMKTGVSDTVLYNEEAVRARYGLLPSQLVDYKAFVGDPSDNIKGVPGVGPKTAQTLLLRFGTLDNIYKNLDQVPHLKEKLASFRAEAELSRELVVLKKDADIPPLDIHDLEVDDNKEKQAAYFKEFGFESLLREGDDISLKKKSPRLDKKIKRPLVEQKKAQGSMF